MQGVPFASASARQARIQADLMAAHARHCFDRIRTRRVANGQDDDSGKAGYGHGAPQFSGETAGEVAGEVRGYLKAMTSLLSPEPPPIPAHQEAAFEGMRGLVGIARELAKGPAGNPVIVDNAERLKDIYVEKLSGGSAAEAAPPPASHAAAAMTPAIVSQSATTGPQSAVVVGMPSPAPARTTPKAASAVPAFQLDRRTVERPPRPSRCSARFRTNIWRAGKPGLARTTPTSRRPASGATCSSN